MAYPDLIADDELDPMTFERDFVPLKKQFFQDVFSNSRLSESQKQRLSSEFSAGIDNAYGASRKPVGDDIQSRQGAQLRDLQFKSSLFSLQKSREDAARERSNMESLAPITRELDAIISDPNMSAEDKAVAHAQWGVRNAGLLSINKPAALAYDASKTGIIKKPQEAKFTVANALQSGAILEDLVEESNKAGKPFNPSDINANVDPYAFSKSLNKQRQRAAQAAYTTKEQDKAEIRRDAEMNRVFDALGSVEFTDPNDPLSEGRLEFMNPKGSFVTNRTVMQYGTEEENALFRKTKTDVGKFKVASEVASRNFAAKSTVSNPSVAVSSLFEEDE